MKKLILLNSILVASLGFANTNSDLRTSENRTGDCSVVNVLDVCVSGDWETSTDVAAALATAEFAYGTHILTTDRKLNSPQAKALLAAHKKLAEVQSKIDPSNISDAQQKALTNAQANVDKQAKAFAKVHSSRILALKSFLKKAFGLSLTIDAAASLYLIHQGEAQVAPLYKMLAENSAQATEIISETDYKAYYQDVYDSYIAPYVKK